MPVVTRLAAIASSHAITTYAPARVQRESTSTPAPIPTRPTICMNVAGETGPTLIASGLRYIVQSVSQLVNLSSPATIGPTPSPIRNTHHDVFSLCSLIATPLTNRVAPRQTVTAMSPL